MIVAIDGPAGSGKTTVAKLLAEKTGIFYLDTGATYRALTLKALEEGADLDNEEVLREIAENLNFQIKEGRFYLDDKDVSDQIRTPLIDKSISAVVCHPGVREVMVNLQRNIVRGKDCVVEGRDTTTIVFPDADYKFFLDANPSTRSRRRFSEMKGKKLKVSFDEVKNDLERRDHADLSRVSGPLRRSEDAFYLDTSDLAVEEVVSFLAKRINR
ncbi:MAG: (d)CMP kinase [Candidatus Omnitrophica bacterium]|nr:(d)CMP kinase [Candidatus Omnitrophota bacterium]MBD3269785.1 (d)CMP kinase [Candidatus Omnitrophota bacterium]